MTTQKLVLLYGSFAAVATVFNLAFQRLSLWTYDGPYGLAIAIFIGTGVGLVVKYVLDKIWIFGDYSRDLSENSTKFALYSLMGVFTTVIFWGTEVTFWSIWRTDLMRELGAVIGLAIGYTVKYHLDKRFVFHTPTAGDVA